MGYPNKEQISKLWIRMKSYINARLESIDASVDLAIDNAIANAGHMEVDLLWENASPSSSFAAQSITVAYTDYDFVFALGQVIDLESDGRHLTTPWIPAVEGKSGFFNYIGTDYYAMSRQMTLASGKITFTSGYMVNTANDATYAEWDNRAVPVAVYGIKGVA